MRIRHNKQGGFSLVEVMIALTIGLITVLVVGQVMQVADARKKNSTSGADAVVNAALGLYTIERDAKNAGYGLTVQKELVGCPIVAKHGENNIQLDLVPAKIKDGTAANPDAGILADPDAPDEIRFLASNKSGIALPMKIVSQPGKGASAVFFVESALGAESGDVMLAVPASISGANWCSIFVHHEGELTEKEKEDAKGQNKLVHPPGKSQLNHPGGKAIFPNAGYAPGDYIINLGTFLDQTYSIRDNRFLELTRFDISTNTGPKIDLYPDIVQLQAVYGKDVDGDGVVEAWNATAPANAAAWQQVLAVRIALVARSAYQEPGIVTLDGAELTTSCDSLTPHAAAVCWKPDPAGKGVKIDVSKSAATWKQYRYRVMETTVPLRNVIWHKGAT